MVDHEDTKTWTKRYVAKNRKECLFLLQETGLLVVRYIDERKYVAAIAGLDSLLNGLIVLQNSKHYGELRSHISMLSLAEGMIMALADPYKMKTELRDLGFQSPYTAEQLDSSNRQTAILVLEDARDFARNEETRAQIVPIIDALKAGWTAGQIRREYAHDFPESVREILLEVDLRFFVPEINQLVSDRGTASPAAPPQRAPEPDYQSQADPEMYPYPERSGPRLTRSQLRRMGFPQWAATVGWDDTDLAVLYQLSRSRRNLFAVLTFCTGPFGVFFAPFWGWAMYWTKAIRYRDFDVMPNTLALFVCGVYYIGGLLLYPFFVLWVVIPLTGWCTRPDQSDRHVPLWTIAGLWGAMLVLALTLFFGIVPLIIGTVAAVVIIWSVKRQTVMPVAIAGALAVVGLVVYLFLNHGPVMMVKGRPFSSGGPGSDLQAGLAGNWYSVDLTCPEGSTEPDAMTLSHYNFQKDGSCVFSWRRYEAADMPEEEGLAAFQKRWRLQNTLLYHETYKIDEDGDLLIRVEGAGNSSDSWEDPLYTQSYRYEIQGDALRTSYAGTDTAYFRTDLAHTDSEALIAEADSHSQRLVGSWSTAKREGNSIWTQTYSFNGDGSFYLQPLGFDNVEYAPMDGETGWYVMPMGHPGSSGTYTFNGGELILHFTADAYFGQEEAIHVLSVGGDQVGQLELDGTRYLSDNRSMEVTALCAALGVDISTS